MTPDEIAETILNTLPPANRNDWQYEVGEATVFLELLFRSSLPLFLDIQAVCGAFGNGLTGVSWQNDLGDEPDSPFIGIEGVIDGRKVHAVFVLNGPTISA